MEGRIRDGVVGRQGPELEVEIASLVVLPTHPVDHGHEELFRLVAQVVQEVGQILLVEVFAALDQRFHQLTLALEVVLEGGELDSDSVSEATHGEAGHPILAQQVFGRIQGLVPAASVRRSGGLGIQASE